MGRVILTGVVPNSERRDERVTPFNPRLPIRYTRGETLRVDIAVLNPTGVPVDLFGATLRMTIKLYSSDDLAIWEGDATLDDLAYGTAHFDVPATAFQFNEPGRYMYDVWLLQAGQSNAVVPASPFIVEPTVRSLF